MENTGKLDEQALHRCLSQRMNRAIASLGRQDIEALLGDKGEDIIQSEIRSFSIEIPVLDWDGRYRLFNPRLQDDAYSHPVVKSDIVDYGVCVPFEGDKEVLAILAASPRKPEPPFGGDCPIGFIEGNSLELRFSIKADFADFISAFERRKTLVAGALGEVRLEAEKFNSRLGDSVRAEAARLKGLYSDAISSLSNCKIPLRPREGAPPFRELPLKRKLVKPTVGPTTKSPPPEPGIAGEHFETILGMIRHTGRTFEAAPSTFAVHGENGFRDWILAALNLLYEGGATGETFRKKGKTDIRIEDGDRSAFVAECKIWGGVAGFKGAVDQLCDYLTWRDCKASLVIFNKFNAKFSELLAKIPGALRSHACFINDVEQDKRGEWRSVFRSRRDGARRIAVHTFIFDIYSERNVGAIMKSFHDSNGVIEHNEFQKWRRLNPKGIVFNCKTRSEGMFHFADCLHYGEMESSEDAWGSLTKRRKICSGSIQEVEAWARANAVSTTRCSDCAPA